jgi:hypothetical protein
MAEVLGLVGALQFATTSVRILNTLRNVGDTRYEELYWMVVAEREVTFNWVRRTQLSGVSALIEQRRRVGDIVKKLQQSYEEMLARFRNYTSPETEKSLRGCLPTALSLRWAASTYFRAWKMR